MRYYQAAVIAFANFRKTFPDSKFLEQIAYLKVSAQFKLAQQSIVSKQMERYTSTIEFYRELIDSFPTSQYLKEAERMYTTSLNQVNFLKSKNKNS
jgi:outer membrane protein assembly factor BamD